MTIGNTEYEEILNINFLDKAKSKMLVKLNVFVLVAVLTCTVVGVILNYFLRMPGAAGGRYLIYMLAGAALCFIYIYLHEIMHFLAILLSTGKRAEIKFGKLVSSCGSSKINYGKAKYFFVASFPVVFFCALLIPLCVFLPPEYFPLPFIPLCYNIFGSLGDLYMIKCALKVRGKCRIVDTGTELHIYLPQSE